MLFRSIPDFIVAEGAALCAIGDIGGHGVVEQDDVMSDVCEIVRASCKEIL